MTYDKTTDDSSTWGRSRHQHGPFCGRGHHFGDSRRWDGLSWVSRPGSHPLKALTVLGGFAIFPPLGVLALGYFLWTSRTSFGQDRGMKRRSTGNTAFDEHQAETINKLRDERRAFFEYRAEQRRKRDQDSYDAFRAGQGNVSDGHDGGPTKE